MIVDLMGVIEHIITEGEEEATKVKFNTEMRKANLGDL